MSMGGSSPAGQTTTQSGPPAWMTPYLQSAMGSGANIYSQYGANPGATVAPFNPVQQQAFQNTNNLDNSLAAGQSNPYMQSLFTQAAQATQPQLASEFAGAGRNITGSMPLRSQQLNNLANQMYGGQYQNMVGNAMSAAQQQQGLGSTIQNQAQNVINAPWTQLGMYDQSLGMNTGNSTSTPYFTNPTANALGTGAAGLGLYNGLNSAFGSGGGKGSSGGGSSGGTDFGGMINNASNWGG